MRILNLLVVERIWAAVNPSLALLKSTIILISTVEIRNSLPEVFTKELGMILDAVGFL